VIAVNPRLRRLQADYDSIRETFSGHKRVKVNPVGSRRPPEIYEIEYSVPGLRLEEGKAITAESHLVELMLPRRYPAEAPYAVPRTPVFHPNIREYYCIADDWRAGTPIVDVILKMGEMIQWRDYNLASPLNDEAADWAIKEEQSGSFPVGEVDLGVPEFSLTESPDSKDGKAAGYAPVGHTPGSEVDDTVLVRVRKESKSA
jgi:ubiquitin-protein ligase